jgi:Holliday junction resolvasome RuvABC endonuclease subunit
MSILALDLGTKTGWAHLAWGVVYSGTQSLATEKELREMRKLDLDRCCDIRIKRLYEFIQSFDFVDHIYFEDVEFQSSRAQTQLWASLRAMVILQHPQRIVRAVPVGTLKKFATGKGNAKKEQMAAALPNCGLALEEKVRDDNEVDALHLLNFAIKELNGSSAQN